MTPEETRDLIAEAREACEMQYFKGTYQAGLMERLADALEAATSERDAQAERVSMEVLDEYRRIAAWLESQAALRGATGDTMHGLAAEALATLIDHEYSRHTIPLYGMLDVWMALHGTSHPDFDEFYDEHGYAEAWSRLMAEIRSRTAVPDAATEVHDPKNLSIMNGWLVECVGEHTCGTEPDGYYGAHEPGCGYEPLVNLSELPGYPDEEKWGVALGDMTERAQKAEAERDAALSTVAKVRELHQPAWDSVSAMYPTPLCGCGEEYRECPTVQVLPPSLAINAGGLNPEGMTP